MQMKVKYARNVLPIAILLVITLSFIYGFYSVNNVEETKNIDLKKTVTPTIITTVTKKITEIIATGAATLFPSNIQAGSQWYVSPSGNDSSDGRSMDQAFKTVQKALDVAAPGSTINLQPGEYRQDFITKRDGTSDNPITIKGPKEATVKGAGNGRVIEINHDYLVLDGFTVDGRHASTNSQDDYRDKLIYAQGKGQHDGVNGLKIYNMTITNAGGECVRLRYYAQNNEIAYNSISNCGNHDYRYDDGGKNGEGIYIGTAPEQRGDGKNPTKDNDESNSNWIHHNYFNTQGNECVDIKENSKFNIVENNTCTGQKDPESGGLDARGGSNIFRYNEIYENEGAGVRLGGDTVGENINNEVYENTIRNNKKGGIKIMEIPQGKICGNIMSGNGGGDAVGEYGEDFDPTKGC